jgi:hypothetical protein
MTEANRASRSVGDYHLDHAGADTSCQSVARPTPSGNLCSGYFCDMQGLTFPRLLSAIYEKKKRD